LGELLLSRSGCGLSVKAFAKAPPWSDSEGHFGEIMLQSAAFCMAAATIHIKTIHGHLTGGQQRQGNSRQTDRKASSCIALTEVLPCGSPFVCHLRATVQMFCRAAISVASSACYGRCIRIKRYPA
jgi:hypothetical protein